MTGTDAQVPGEGGFIGFSLARGKVAKPRECSSTAHTDNSPATSTSVESTKPTPGELVYPETLQSGCSSVATETYLEKRKSAIIDNVIRLVTVSIKESFAQVRANQGESSSPVHLRKVEDRDLLEATRISLTVITSGSWRTETPTMPAIKKAVAQVVVDRVSRTGPVRMGETARYFLPVLQA